MAFRIVFPRGDSFAQGFVMKRNDSTVTTVFDEIYFTVKKSYKDTNFVLQQKLTDGDIVYDGNGHYTLFLEPEDTSWLDFTTYECDFEFILGEEKKTFVGTMQLTKEITCIGNE